MTPHSTHPIPAHALQANNFIQFPACFRQGYIIIVVPKGGRWGDWSSQPSFLSKPGV